MCWRHGTEAANAALDSDADEGDCAEDPDFCGLDLHWDVDLLDGEIVAIVRWLNWHEG